MKSEQFKVGMRVVAVDKCDGMNLRGKTGTVRETVTWCRRGRFAETLYSVGGNCPQRHRSRRPR